MLCPYTISMMIREITAKTILITVKRIDPWFGLKYNMNLYRGCQHRCIYCDSRSECYQIEDFDGEVLVKVNAVEVLRKELARKRVKGLIGTGSMNDPYMPLEAERQLMQGALQAIADYRFPVHIMTKSSLVLRDLDILTEIARIFATISFTITTIDDELGKKLEPGAALVSERFHAMEELAKAGIQTGVTMMPILPFIEDTVENVTAIVERAHACGATYFIPWFGMSMRDRQRAHFYERLDRLFPGVREKYERRFGLRYGCQTPAAKHLDQAFQELKARFNFDDHIHPYESQRVVQGVLF